jgi:ribose/xylose/arabinose/galactoside ABC-type transport system permease subunit
MKNIPRLRLPAWLPSLPSLASLGKREIAGLPLPFWLFVGVVVLTGIGLGVAVWQKFSR